MFDLKGKVALVTGGNGGIGLGMAEALARSGAAIAIWGRNQMKNDAATARLRTITDKVLAQRVDVAQETEVVDGMQNLLAHFGRLDTVFVNAGIARFAPSFVGMDTELYRDVLSVNLDGAFWTLREAARHMTERARTGDKGGSLVGVASLAAIEGAARNQAYAATKGGLISMMKACAVEFARNGIRANTILPGWIETEMTAAAFDSEAVAQHVIPRVPMRRWGEPADFGGIAVYLAADASAYHTGDTFIIDGGYSIF